MRSLKFRLLGAAAVAVLAGVVVAAEPTLSADLSGKTIEADTGHLGKLLDLATNSKKKVGGRVKATAVLLALNADENLAGKDAAKMATLRDEALKIAAKAKTPAAVSKEIEGLAKLEADPKASTKPLGAKKILGDAKLSVEEVMELFGAAGAGGMNLEKDIKELSKSGVKNLPAAELLAARTALLADATLHLPNDKAAGGNKKDWDSTSADMKKFAREIATEAAKGNKANLAAIKTAAGKLDASCTNCHNKFRD